MYCTWRIFGYLDLEIFGSCGVGECTADLFITSVIMVCKDVIRGANSVWLVGEC